MKRHWIMLGIVLIVLLAGCDRELTRVEKAQVVADNYIRIIYTVEDFSSVEGERVLDYHEEVLDRLEPYITEKMADLVSANRETVWTAKIASSIQALVSVEEVSFDRVIEEEGKIFLDYSASLKLSYQDGSEETVIQKGALQLIETDKLKINHYRHLNNALEDLHKPY